MTDGRPTLVVGGTGVLGGEIIRLLRAGGRRVRALVRPGADRAARGRLESLGVELATGDLKDRASIEQAVNGTAVLISTATAMRARRPGDSIATVDGRGQLDLVDAAERLGVGQVVFVSFPPAEVDFPLQRAKRAVEQKLRDGRTAYTILQPTNFCEIWLGPRRGVDIARRRATVFGDGDRPIGWIRVSDVARFAVAASDGGAWSGRTIGLAGPEMLSPLQAIAMFEEMVGEKFEREHVSLAQLEQRLAQAKDDVEASAAGTALATARGASVDPAAALELLPVSLGTVREYAVDRVKNDH